MFPGQTTSAINHNTHRMYIVQQEDYVTTCCEECMKIKGFRELMEAEKKRCLLLKKQGLKGVAEGR